MGGKGSGRRAVIRVDDKERILEFSDSIATLCAVARCALTGSSEYLVTPDDVRACACILRAGKCDSRKEMQEKIELKQCAKYKSENEVWAEIREKLQNPIRLDKLNEWIRRRPPVYSETYTKMRSRGETVEERSAEKKRGRIVRLATDEERQKAEEERQKAEEERQKAEEERQKAKTNRPAAYALARTVQRMEARYGRKR